VKADRLFRTLLLAIGPYLAVGCSGSRPAVSEPPPETPSEPSVEKTPKARLVPRDGSVYMDCKEGRCLCHLESHTPPRAVVEFEFAASCSSVEVMRQLMRDHCLAGMEVLPRAGESEERPSEK
jgi:hypothetical protein